jgi:hypothetical protein
MPPAPVQRSLTLIAKVLQSLANLSQVRNLVILVPGTTLIHLRQSTHKEEYMRKVKQFLQQSRPAMVDYILVVSTPIPEQRPQLTTPNSAAFKYQRIHILNSLRERSVTMPTLHREAILLLPHLLDVSKHLAILTSAVVRKAKIKAQRPQNSLIEEFSRKCCDVEDKALESVTQLIRKRNVALGHPSTTHLHPQCDHRTATCQSCAASTQSIRTYALLTRTSASTASLSEVSEDRGLVPSSPTSPSGEIVEENSQENMWQIGSSDKRPSFVGDTQPDVSPFDKATLSKENGDETRRKNRILEFFAKR